MKTDRFDNVLSTTSDTARDAYVAATDDILAGNGSLGPAFQKALDADPEFALGHAGLARALQYSGDMAGATAAITVARSLANRGDAREQSHINALGLLIDGKTAEGYAAVRAHVDEHPRDALIAQTCSSVFGLIGFSGRPGREAEILAFTASLMPHYGDDWWCVSQYAFALCENGDLDRADALIETSLSRNPRNANAAHVRSHIYYEQGEGALGRRYLDGWMPDYDRDGYLHGHLAWHSALWALEDGAFDLMWERLTDDIKPGGSIGLPINILTDTASLLFRAEVAGLKVPSDLWAEVSRYAAQFFPRATLGFTDFHAAMAHAMAGDDAAMSRLIEAPNPVTGHLVTPLAEGFRAFAAGDWARAVDLFTSAMADHARLGGSRAQRDVLEFALLSALLKQGRDAEAQRLLALRRPVLAHSNILHGATLH